MEVWNALETAGQEDSYTGRKKAPEPEDLLVDEEREVIEVFGGNPQVCHHRHIQILSATTGTELCHVDQCISIYSQ